MLSSVSLELSYLEINRIFFDVLDPQLAVFLFLQANA